jgi:hypothetical protein
VDTKSENVLLALDKDKSREHQMKQRLLFCSVTVWYLMDVVVILLS